MNYNRRNTNEEMILYWFASIVGVSHKRKLEIFGHCNSLFELYDVEELRNKALFKITEREMQALKDSKKNWDLEERFANMKAQNANFVTINEKNYPQKLKEAGNPPFALFYKGMLPSENEKLIAIVGARRCSPYGEAWAHEIGKVLSQHKVSIVSGLAKGIDGIAQRAALQAGGRSYGVLGSGVNICYPREHIGLYSDMCKAGGILSELPLDMQPLAHHFPLRNRIISGISDALIIIEAKKKSGSLITADCALEQGKDVYALPGPIDSELSKGCHWLIQQGAGLISSLNELLLDLSIENSENKLILQENIQKNKNTLESIENLVYSCLDLHPKNIEWISQQTNCPIEDLLVILVTLELKGFVREISKNYYVRK